MTKWTEPFGIRRRLSWQSDLNKRLIFRDPMRQVIKNKAVAGAGSETLKKTLFEAQAGKPRRNCGRRDGVH
jgi:hypothetical protein